MRDLPKVKLTMRCTECGHIQYVKSATQFEDNEGKHYYFGSAYDFCDECDGVPEIIDRVELVD